jgi:myo-inositol 2-dehydrogenase/D-chiro-inositol 1-dehydrogenase
VAPVQAGPPIRVSIVGCGAVAELFYAPALRALENAGLAKVVALVDPSRDRMAHLRRNFPDAATLADARQLEGGDRDLAIIASPVRFHAEHAINALKAGFAVLCEKPMAATVAQAEAMVEQANESGKVLAIGLFRRLYPATSTIHDLIGSGALRSTRSFHV